MMRIADTRAWHSREVIDAQGCRIGALEAVYADTGTDEPAVAAVQVGPPTPHRLVLVPLDDAVVGPGYVRVGYDRALVEMCPSVRADDVMPAAGEAAIVEHYGLKDRPVSNGERQPARR
ncbi:PRC-barrel domain-containing protein [Streptomyces sp. NPDC059819]|uniref:PRC-barrel domain-containing protein n=1 Tax=Streptomyces sp. NPDC059819 TaxID=3346963 RepID=UPI0036548E65